MSRHSKHKRDRGRKRPKSGRSFPSHASQLPVWWAAAVALCAIALDTSYGIWVISQLRSRRHVHIDLRIVALALVLTVMTVIYARLLWLNRRARLQDRADKQKPLQ